MVNTIKSKSEAKANAGELANVQAATDAMMGDLELETVTAIVQASATNNMAAFPDGTNPLYGAVTGDYIRQPATKCTYYVTSAGRVSQDSCPTSVIDVKAIRAESTSLAVTTPPVESQATPTVTPMATITPTSTPKPTIRVTKTADTSDGVCDADCSLREALRSAVSGYTIVIPAGTYTLALGGLDSVENDLILLGAGAVGTIIQAAETVGEANNGVFKITAPAKVTISGVTIRHGNSRHDGGGVFNYGGVLTLTDSIITGNMAGSRGGGIYSEAGSLILINSTVNENVAPQGGGIYSAQSNATVALFLINSAVSNNTASHGGGIFNRSSTLTLTNSTISGNTLERLVSFGSLFGGGIHSHDGNVTLTNTTISGNTSIDGGGGIFKYGWGMLILTNSTVSGNSANQGGGIHTSGELALSNNTITENQGKKGGGIYYEGVAATIVNTIIAGNSASSGPDCSGKFTSMGHNLVGNAIGCGFEATGGDQVGFQFGIDPKLSPLAENGGPTKTHALMDDSPAIDGGDNGHAPEFDQRGVSRPQGMSSDIGAFES